MDIASPVLSVGGLRTEIALEKGRIVAVDDLSFAVNRGEAVAIVGESGCGKSMTALSILGLLPKPHAVVTQGTIQLGGIELTAQREQQMRAIRGRDVGMIFQEPMTSLNPVQTIGAQIVEAIRLHLPLSRRQARERAVELLRMVRLPNPETQLHSYPHHLSGGMRQRVMIAIAIACGPKLLIADEPTTALDVTVQAEILSLLKDLQKSMGMAILLISHDFGVVSWMTNRVVVMYAGRKVEEGLTATVLRNPSHPYTQGLLGALPQGRGRSIGKGRSRLQEIPGMVPPLSNLPPGCAFAPRCSWVTPQCKSEPPREVRVSVQHGVSCFVAENALRTSPRADHVA